MKQITAVQMREYIIAREKEVKAGRLAVIRDGYNRTFFIPGVPEYVQITIKKSVCHALKVVNGKEVGMKSARIVNKEMA